MSFVENLSPSTLKGISKELMSLYMDPPEGITVIPNENNVADIQAWILGPDSTPYQGGAFKVRIVLGNEFPQAPPKCKVSPAENHQPQRFYNPFLTFIFKTSKGFFVTKIFHPNVSKAGEVCVNTLKKDWRKELGLTHIFLTVKCLLIVPNPESALNEEAGRLLLENYTDYAQHATLMTSIHAPFSKFEQHRKEFSSWLSSMGSSQDNTTPSISNTKMKDQSEEKDGSKVSENVKKQASSIPDFIQQTEVSIRAATENVDPQGCKKRMADKRLDKKKADKKRSLKRL